MSQAITKYDANILNLRQEWRRPGVGQDSRPPSPARGPEGPNGIDRADILLLSKDETGDTVAHVAFLNCHAKRGDALELGRSLDHLAQREGQRTPTKLAGRISSSLRTTRPGTTSSTRPAPMATLMRRCSVAVSFEHLTALRIPRRPRGANKAETVLVSPIYQTHLSQRALLKSPKYKRLCSCYSRHLVKDRGKGEEGDIRGCHNMCRTSCAHWRPSDSLSRSYTAPPEPSTGRSCVGLSYVGHSCAGRSPSSLVEILRDLNWTTWRISHHDHPRHIRERSDPCRRTPHKPSHRAVSRPDLLVSLSRLLLQSVA